MGRHFRTITTVVEIEDDSDLRYFHIALDVTGEALKSAGFTVLGMRNEHNESGDLPPRSKETTR